MAKTTVRQSREDEADASSAAAQPESGKAAFDSIYDQADPRAYYRAMAELDYLPPEHGRLIFLRCLAALAELRGVERPTVLDLCCGYGVNAALLRHEIELADLYAYYTGKTPEGDPRAADRAFFAACPKRAPEPRVIGLDAASNALGYAASVGLLERGLTVDLEGRPEEHPDLSGEAVDLISVTGGVGYIGAATFRGVLAALPRNRPPPWVACLVLRFVPFQECVAALAEFGLVTERWTDTTFTQRRIADAEERSFVLAELDRLGLDPAGREAAGWLHCDLFIARPQDEVERLPLPQLLGPAVDG